MMFERVPEKLRARRQWVLWRHMQRDGEKTKLPFQANGKAAKSNDPATWNTFEAIVKAYRPKRDAGIGYVFAETDPFVGVDFDGCRDPETGKVSTWARDWIVKLDSYSEVSPSKTGVKVWVEGKSPFPSGRKEQVDAEPMGGKQPAVEIYDKLRYFAVTGWNLEGHSLVEPNQPAVDELAKKFFPTEQSLPHVPLGHIDSVSERAEKYIAKLPEAVSGQNGHGATFHAACVLVLGFGLSPDEAFPVLAQWNATHCKPEWSEQELRHKLADANKQSGERNYLRDARPEQWDRIKVPKYSRQVEEPVTSELTLQAAATEYLDVVSAGKLSLIELGISDLDYAIGGGVAPGEVVIIAARPGHGKSAVALQCLDWCSRSGMAGLIISEEMSHLAIGKRVLQFVSDVPEESWAVEQNRVRDEIEYHYQSRKPVYIAESCRTAIKAAATIEWYGKEKGVQVAAVDYAQLLGSSGNSRYEQITATSIALRTVANKTGMTLLVLCQLSRQIEHREKFIPKAADLKDSGQLEQDADVVIFLVWPHRIDDRKPAKEFQIFVCKNRNRAINTSAITCEFLPTRQLVRMEHSTPKRVAEFDEWNNRRDFAP